MRARKSRTSANRLCSFLAVAKKKVSKRAFPVTTVDVHLQRSNLLSGKTDADDDVLCTGCSALIFALSNVYTDICCRHQGSDFREKSTSREGKSGGSDSDYHI